MSSILRRMMVFVAPVPSGEALDAIAIYRYKPDELATPLTTNLDKLGLEMVSYFPPWLAPNLITVGGALPLVAVAVCIATICPASLVGPAPQWLFIAAAAVIVWQVLCDECDGRQARRLGVGSSLGRLMDHGTDALMAVFVMWCAQLILQYPSRLIIVGQAISSVVALVMPWTERYKGAFPIYLAAELLFAIVFLLLAGGILGPEQVHTVLVMSPVDALYNVNLRSLLIGVAPSMVAIYNIATTLTKAKEMGVLRRAALEVIQPMVIVPATLMLSDDILSVYARHISVILGSLIAIYFLQGIIKAMGNPHYHDSILIDKPYMLLYVAFALSSRLLPTQALSTIMPYYTGLAVLVTCAWYYVVFGAVKRRLGIVEMFRVPAVKQQAFLEPLLG